MILEKLKELISEQMGIEADTITLESNFEEDLGVPGLRQMKLPRMKARMRPEIFLRTIYTDPEPQAGRRKKHLLSWRLCSMRIMSTRREVLFR